jgi:hypothetical protein
MMYNERNSTSILCESCKTNNNITTIKLQTEFKKKQYSGILVFSKNYVILVYVNSASYLFSIIYKWLDIKNNVSLFIFLLLLYYYYIFF